MHYINENEDVLVSLDETIPEGFYQIPTLDLFWLAQAVINGSLFIASKCYCLAYKETEKQDTPSMTYEKWMQEKGYLFENYYYNLEYSGKYTKYDMLTLACRYGGNNRNFEILKPFIIPKEYIIAEYDSQKIKLFIDKLKNEGFIVI